MRKSAKNRIIVWSVVTGLLIGILCAGLIAVQNYNFGFYFFDDIPGFMSGEDMSQYSYGNCDFTAEAISSFDINWTSGSVEIIADKTDKVTIEESSDKPLSEDNKLRYSLDNGKLRIRQYPNMSVLFGLSGSKLAKNLKITVPNNKSFSSLGINSASAGITLDGIQAEDTDAETISGKISLNNFKGYEASLSTTSGTIIFGGDLKELSLETVSGRIEVNSDPRILSANSVSGAVNMTLGNSIEDIECETVSGGINMYLHQSINGFTAELDTVSGYLSSDFSTSLRDNKISFGNGKAEIDLHTVSGSASILFK